MELRSFPQLSLAPKLYSLGWLTRQILLVPEAVLLLSLLAIHLGLGRPLWTVVLAALVVMVFAGRVVLLSLGGRALARADYPAAERWVRLARRCYPWSADVQHLQAHVHLSQGHVASAVTALQQAIALFPGHAPLHAALAGLLLEQGLLAEARREALKAQALNPRCGLGYLHLAQYHELQGELAESESLLRNALGLQLNAADRALALLLLARVLVAAGQLADVPELLQQAETLLSALDPRQQAVLQYQLGERYMAVGQVDAARTAYRLCETLDPRGRFAQPAWSARNA